MNYKYLWQKNKARPDGKLDKEVIKGVFREANAYMQSILRKIKIIK